MPRKIYDGIAIDINEEGYMINPSQWTKEIAVEIALEEKIILTDQHFAIIEFLRTKFTKGETLSIRSVYHSGIMDVKTFYNIFPGAPLRKATRIAGIPKPSNCI